MRVATINIEFIRSGKCRCDGKHFLNNHSYLTLPLETNLFRCCRLEELAEVFNPPVFKRQFCLNGPKSVKYFQSSDILSSLENSYIYINKEQALSLNLIVKKNDILVTGFGTIGDTRLVSKFQDGTSYANNVCRIRVRNGQFFGAIYAFMASKYGHAQLNKNASGSVVRYIEAPGIKKTLIPILPDSLKNDIDTQIQKSSRLREDAIDILMTADRLLKTKVGLRELTSNDYDYFGNRSYQRQVSCFTRNIQEIGTTTINAFNHSERIRKIKAEMTCPTRPLKDFLLGHDTFSTGSFPRIEVNPGHGIMLINQSDIFDTIIKGKYISRRGVKVDNLVEYGEVLVAGVGTLGENETFCRTIFANEDLTGQLVSGEFIRMKTTNDMPSGYLFTWLSSDYGFRLLRNLQTGTKLCRPIPKLILELPVPIIDKESMQEIDRLVREAHTKRHLANQMELKAISMVEQEIEKWNN